MAAQVTDAGVTREPMKKDEDKDEESKISTMTFVYGCFHARSHAHAFWKGPYVNRSTSLALVREPSRLIAWDLSNRCSNKILSEQ